MGDQCPVRTNMFFLRSVEAVCKLHPSSTQPWEFGMTLHVQEAFRPKDHRLKIPYPNYAEWKPLRP